MKKIILIAFMTLFMSGITFAANDADTLAVDNVKIEQIIEDKTTNTKGKPVTKYYIMYDGELCNTSKTVVDKLRLCKKYNAKCALAIVIKRGSKRIILD